MNNSPLYGTTYSELELLCGLHFFVFSHVVVLVTCPAFMLVLIFSVTTTIPVTLVISMVQPMASWNYSSVALTSVTWCHCSNHSMWSSTLSSGSQRKISLRYYKFGNVRENLIFANRHKFDALWIQSSR